MNCPHCNKLIEPLKKVNPAEYRKRKVAGAKAAHRKAKERGTKLGRPKRADYGLIRMLRAEGESLGSIAVRQKVSIATVMRALKKIS